MIKLEDISASILIGYRMTIPLSREVWYNKTLNSETILNVLKQHRETDVALDYETCWKVDLDSAIFDLTYNLIGVNIKLFLSMSDTLFITHRLRDLPLMPINKQCIYFICTHFMQYWCGGNHYRKNRQELAEFVLTLATS